MNYWIATGLSSENGVTDENGNEIYTFSSDMWGYGDWAYDLTGRPANGSEDYYGVRPVICIGNSVEGYSEELDMQDGGYVPIRWNLSL